MKFKGSRRKTGAFFAFIADELNSRSELLAAFL
jgi:hypothetical protein